MQSSDSEEDDEDDENNPKPKSAGENNDDLMFMAKTSQGSDSNQLSCDIPCQLNTKTSTTSCVIS